MSLVNQKSTINRGEHKANLVCLKEGVYYNPTKDSYLIEMDKKEDIGFFSLSLQVTKRCNADCIHCAASQSTKELSTDKMKELIKKIHAEGCVRLSFTGGEPLLRNDLVEIVKYSKKIGMINSLSTNTFALNEQKIKALKPYLDNIRCSLHGLKKNNNFIFQKQDAFEAIINNIRLSLEHDLSVGVIFSVMQRNVADMVPLAKKLEAMGVNKLTVFTLMSAGRAKGIFAKEKINIDEVQLQMKRIKQLKKEHDWNLEVSLVDWALEGQCALVDANGILYFYDLSQPNHYLRLGSVLENDLRDLWQEFPHKNNYFQYYQHH